MQSSKYPLRWALILTIAFALATSTLSPNPTRAASDVIVYADALATGWQNWSWNTSSTLTATIRVQANASGAPISSIALGTNLPAWLNPTGFADTTFRARAKASGATLIRIPGGSWSDAYGWLSCETRTDVPGAGPCSYWNWASRPSDFIKFLRAMGQQAMYTMNVNVTSKEAAAAVAFFNSRITDTTTIGTDIHATNWYTAGHWAQLRASRGLTEPLGIKYWEFGNEIYGGKPGPKDCVSFGWEEAWTCDGTEYVNGIGVGSARHEGYLEFRAAMKAVDPAIQFGAVGYEEPSGYSNWTNEVIAAADDKLDFLVVHPYAYFNLPPATQQGFAEILAKPQAHLGKIKSDLQAAFNTYAGGRQAPVAITEFNVVSVQDQDNNQLMTRMVNALFIADSIGQAIKNGYMTLAQWDLANGRASNGTDYGLLHVDNDWFRSPQYYAFPLWSRFGDAMLPVTSTADAATTLSVYAGRVSSDTVTVLAINKTDSTISGTIALDGVSNVTSGAADVVKAPSLSSQSATFNGAANPSDDLSNGPSLPVNVSGGTSLIYAFEPYSITLLKIKVNNGPAPVRDKFMHLPLLRK